MGNWCWDYRRNTWTIGDQRMEAERREDREKSNEERKKMGLPPMDPYNHPAERGLA